MNDEQHDKDRDDLSALIDLVANRAQRSLLLAMYTLPGASDHGWIDPEFVTEAGGSEMLKEMVRLRLVEQDQAGRIRMTDRIRVRRIDNAVTITLTGPDGESLEMTYPSDES